MPYAILLHCVGRYCNMTIGWKRGGGNNIFLPKTWPTVGGTISKRRIVPFSYAMVRVR